MDGLGLYVLVNSILVISGQWKGDYKGAVCNKVLFRFGRISPPAGFKPKTLSSEVRSANCSASWML